MDLMNNDFVSPYLLSQSEQIFRRLSLLSPTSPTSEGLIKQEREAKKKDKREILAKDKGPHWGKKGDMRISNISTKNQRLNLKKSLSGGGDEKKEGGEPGFLLIRVKNAKNLKNTSKIPQRPYVLLTVGNTSAATKLSKTMEKANWEDLFDFMIEDKNTEKIQMMVLARHLEEAREVPIAQVEVSIHDLHHFETVERDLELLGVVNSEPGHGQLKIVLRFLSLANSKKDIHLDRYGFPVSSRKAYELALQAESKYGGEGPSLMSGTQKAARLGIPFPYKARHWQIFMMKFLNLSKTPFPNGLYEKLLQETGNRVLLKQIDKDLPRTFPNHSIFMSKEGKEALRRILKAFSIKHPEIGYTQAMNFIAGYLLLLMEEELAFKVLSMIVEYFVPGYYMNTMVGLQTDQVVLNLLVKEKLPNLYEHLPKIDVDLNVVSTKWFLCLFIHTLPFPSVLRLWDILFCKGPATLILAGLAILKIKEKEILAINRSLKTTTDFLDEITLTFYNWEQLIQEMYTISTFAAIEQMQAEAREKIQVRIKKRQISDLEIITRFKENELAELEKIFSALATNGSVNKSDFTKLFDKKYAKFVEDPSIKDIIFAEFDKNGDGTLDFRDYAISLSTLCKGTPKEKVKLLLNIFGKDGFMGPEELTILLMWQFRTMGFRNPEDMLQTSVQMAFSEFDLDNDGKLSLDEFFLVCNKQPALVQMLDLVD